MTGNKEIIESKRKTREGALASAPAFVAKTHEPYLHATASQIVENIESGKWTASQVVDAFIARAAVAHQTTNCLTEVLFGQARKEAEELDQEFAKTGKLRGPLHGVPFSFKDQFDITGVDSSIGFSQWANKPSDSDAGLVSLFRSQGAIIIAKTNVPQTMLAFECSNPLWGRTTNPWSENYTCGGSSGGEGALLGMDGSAMGIGSDIGGSLRIPASYCGIYSLKPGYGRLTTSGARSPNEGFHVIQSVVGPMSRSVSDVELFCRTAFGVQDRLKTVAPVPYREVQLPSKLRFGYYTSDDYVKASPANMRAVLETVAALEKEGHECIEFQVPQPSRAMEIFAGITSADGYKRLTSHLGPDTQEKSLFLVTLGPKLPAAIRVVATWLIESAMGDNIFATLLRAARYKSVGEYTAFSEQKDIYEKLFYEEVWYKQNFDGIIAPVQAVPTISHGACATLSPLAGATILYNMVDSPVGVIPVTRVDPLKDQITDSWIQGPGHGSRMLEREVYEGKTPVYDPKKMDQIPVGVQIVGKRWEEEKVIAMMHVVDKALGPRGFGPGSSLGIGESKRP